MSRGFFLRVTYVVIFIVNLPLAILNLVVASMTAPSCIQEYPEIQFTYLEWMQLGSVLLPFLSLTPNFPRMIFQILRLFDLFLLAWWRDSSLQNSVLPWMRTHGVGLAEIIMAPIRLFYVYGIIIPQLKRQPSVVAPLIV